MEQSWHGKMRSKHRSKVRIRRENSVHDTVAVFRKFEKVQPVAVAVFSIFGPKTGFNRTLKH